MKSIAVLLIAIKIFALYTQALGIDKRDGMWVAPKTCVQTSLINAHSSSSLLDTAPDNKSNGAAVEDSEDKNYCHTHCCECNLDPGVCCFDECQSDGHCPWIIIENSGMTINGFKITKKRSNDGGV